VGERHHILADGTRIVVSHGYPGFASRKVLAFRLSNTLTTDFCIEALEEALAKFGAPDIFNTDHDLSVKSMVA
jgi:putative transposase